MTSPVELTVLNVGHGNAAVVSWTDPITNKPRASMVDAGPSKEFLQDYLKANRIYSISVLVISHAHDDHYMGAINILADEDITIGHIYAPVANKKQDKQWKRFRDGLTNAQSRGATVDLVAHDGSDLNPSGDPGYKDRQCLSE